MHGPPRMAEPSHETLLEFRNVHTHYGDLHVLKDVSYTIRRGEIVSLLGGNASGKSTTMKVILGLVRPRAGTVRFEGQDITALPTPAIIARGLGSGVREFKAGTREGQLEDKKEKGGEGATAGTSTEAGATSDEAHRPDDSSVEAEKAEQKRS